MFLELQKSTPGINHAELLWVLQIWADYQWPVEVADVSAAFCQTDAQLPENTRSHRLFVRLPSSGMACFPGATMVELQNEIYGLTTGPRAWRNTFVAALKAQEWQVHPMSPCVFLKFETMAADEEQRVWSPAERPALPLREGQLGGIILLQVDDVLTGGTGPLYKKSRQSLSQRFTSGKWSTLDAAREYNGRTLRQYSQSEFSIDMHKALAKVKPLEIPSNRQQEPSEADVRAFRGLIGSLLWIARCGAPQTLAATSPLASKASKLTVADMKMANKALQHLVTTEQPTYIKGISPAKGGYILYSDASLANLQTRGPKQQWGLAECIEMTFDWLERAPSPSRIMLARSSRGVASSPLMAESAALAQGLAHLEWMAVWRGYATQMGYQRPVSKQGEIELVASEKSRAAVHDAVAVVVDSKSRFDVTVGDGLLY